MLSTYEMSILRLIEEISWITLLPHRDKVHKVSKLECGHHNNTRHNPSLQKRPRVIRESGVKYYAEVAFLNGLYKQSKKIESDEPSDSFFLKGNVNHQSRC